ncbi:hypothetical protein AX17_003734 [Amanita inopinata Kibby_2008]|nr:hypothetical protein AX17_003734 [Amanita inopinata Kibby_2008]
MSIPQAPPQCPTSDIPFVHNQAQDQIPYCATSMLDVTEIAETTVNLSKEFPSSLPSRNKEKVTSQARCSVSPYPLPIGLSNAQQGTSDISLLKLYTPKETTALSSITPAIGSYTETALPHASQLSSPQYIPTAEDPLEIFFPPELHLLTPAPPKGFPEVHGLDAVEILRYVSQVSRNNWASVPSNKILVYLANDKPVYNTDERMERIRAFLNAIFPSHPSITIDCPVPRKKMMRALIHKPVFPYLIAGLTDRQKDILLSRRVWSTKTISFFAIPFKPPVSSYALTLAGIFLNPPHEHVNTVAADVRETLSASRRVRYFIEGCNDNIDNAIEDKFSFILDSISVRGQWLYLNKQLSAIFFVYIHPPTKLSSYHRRWLAMLRRIRYVTSFGIGEHVMNEWKCNVCKGFDHPTGLCRYPSLPGWNPPLQFGGRRGRYISSGVPDFNERQRKML